MKVKLRSVHINDDDSFSCFRYWGIDYPKVGCNSSPSMVSGTFIKSHEQYIGRKDKNGNEIYAGDILGSFVHKEIQLQHIVEWSDKYLCWYMWNIKDVNRTGDGSVQAFVYFKNSGKNAEIVGNIHETRSQK